MRAQQRRPMIRQLAQPLVASAWANLVRRCRPDVRTLLSRGAARSLRESLVARLSFTGEQAAAWLYRATENTPGVRMASDADVQRALFASGREAATARFLQRFPALRSLWTTQVECWVDFAEELLCRAREFYKRGREISTTRPMISFLGLDLSDLHDGNRSVAQVRFQDGTSWFYKPRSGEPEEVWFDLLTQLNANGAPASFYLVKVVCGNGYFWMQEVPHRACRTVDEVCRFFFRAGALVCLVHRLGGADYHAGNLIACGEHPVIIDCETFFHPASKLPTRWRREEGSVLRTGMLPIQRNGVENVDSVSAFGRRSPGQHAVRRGRRIASADDFSDEIMAGFCAMNSYLSSAPGWTVFQAAANRLQRCDLRRLYRPTPTYYRILSESLAPSCLRDSRTRGEFLRRACRRGPTPRRYLPQEVAALAKADIPAIRAKAAPLRDYTNETLARDVRELRSALGAVISRRASR